MAELIVRVGLNLQPGQSLLITDPYDLLGVHPEAMPLAAAIKSVGGAKTTILEADPGKLRACVETGDVRNYTTRVALHTAWLRRNLQRHGAFLFLTGSASNFFAGLPADCLDRFNAVKWRQLGPIIQHLVGGATQWTLAPAPTSKWADAAFAHVPVADRLPALWQTVFAAMRVGPPLAAGPVPSLPTSGSPTSDAIALWRAHLATLARRRDELNAARFRRIRYFGPGTDITLELPRSHAWCTAQRVSKAGVTFVANLPTEEIFTAPHKNSACGMMRAAGPVVHTGSVIAGIELEFHRGQVVAARASAGQDILEHLLATDSGAVRIGEVAVVENIPRWASVSTLPPIADSDIGGHPAPLFHHALLDENAANHIALGDAYRFCSRARLPLALNSSQVHLDLPLDAKVELL
jgi:aminopeptidase